MCVCVCVYKPIYLTLYIHIYAYTCVYVHCGRPEFDPWVRKIPGEGNGNPLQYSCLENPMDKEA